jgi:hypothetical protein
MEEVVVHFFVPHAYGALVCPPATEANGAAGSSWRYARGEGGRRGRRRSAYRRCARISSLIFSCSASKSGSAKGVSIVRTEFVLFAGPATGP